MQSVITLEELQERRAGGRVVVAEILPPAHYEAGHLPGAINLPLAGFQEQVSRALGDPDADVVVYCSGPTCNNSHVAAEKLTELGYRRVRVFAGGKAAWRDAGLPFEVSAR